MFYESVINRVTCLQDDVIFEKYVKTGFEHLTPEIC